jgi:hypothetical protein
MIFQLQFCCIIFLVDIMIIIFKLNSNNVTQISVILQYHKIKIIIIRIYYVLNCKDIKFKYINI